MKKRNLKIFRKRGLALLLAAVMVAGTPQLVSLAEDGGDISDSEGTDYSLESYSDSDSDSDSNDNGDNSDDEGGSDSSDVIVSADVSDDSVDAPDDSASTSDSESVTEPWTDTVTVGEEPEQIEVSGEITTTVTETTDETTNETITETTVEWDGSGEHKDENGDGVTHVEVEGEENTTTTTESTDVDIELEDTAAGGSGITVEIPVNTAVVDGNGLPKAPEGYFLKSDDGDVLVYTKTEGDNTSEWTLQKINQEVSDGQTTTYYKTLGVDGEIEWEVVEQRDANNNVISTNTSKIIRNETGEIIQRDSVDHVTVEQTVEVTKPDVAEKLEQHLPKEEDGYTESTTEDDTANGIRKFAKTENGTHYVWTVKEVRDENTNELLGYETVISDEKVESVPWSESDTEQFLRPTAPDGYTSEDGVNYSKTDAEGYTWKWEEIPNGYKTIEETPTEIITVEVTFENGTKIITTRHSTTTRETVTETEDGKVEVTVGAVTEGSEHGTSETKGLTPNLKHDPANGTTNTTTDLYGLPDAQPFTITVTSSLNIRKGPSSANYPTTGKYLKNGDTVTVNKIELDENGALWGCIGKDQWIHLGYASAPLPDEGNGFHFSGGYGLSSAVMVNYLAPVLDKDGNPVMKDGQPVMTEKKYNVHQFVVYDSNGKPHYAYCADLSVSPDKVDYNITNVEDSGFYDTEAAEQISAIALNGYWGTSSDTGSLDSFKEWLIEIGFAKSKSELNWISGGIAMSATQAAIWYYGSSGDLTLADNPFVFYNYNGNYYQYDRLHHAGVTTENDTQKHVKAIYDYLINNPDIIKEKNVAPPATDLINADSLGKVKVTVGKNIKDLENSIDSKSETTNDVYSTDVSFYLDVTNSRLNKDDFIVRVYAIGSDEPLYTYRLATEDSKSALLVNNNVVGSDGIIIENADGSFTLKDLELENGVEVTLRITGTQTLTKNAYLISASGGYDKSQTFISVEEGERNFDLSLNITLNVAKGQATIESEVSEMDASSAQWSWNSNSTDSSESKDDNDDGGGNENNEGDDDDDDDDNDNSSNESDSDSDSDDDSDADADADTDSDSDDDADSDDPGTPVPFTDDPGDPVSLMDVPGDPVPLAELPAEDASLTDILDEDVPLAALPRRSSLVDIFDEEVPLANIPQTGDISDVWYAIAVLSAAGLLCLAVLERKKRKNA